MGLCVCGCVGVCVGGGGGGGGIGWGVGGGGGGWRPGRAGLLAGRLRHRTHLVSACRSPAFVGTWALRITPTPPTSRACHLQLQAALQLLRVRRPARCATAGPPRGAATGSCCPGRSQPPHALDLDLLKPKVPGHGPRLRCVRHAFPHHAPFLYNLQMSTTYRPCWQLWGRATPRTATATAWPGMSGRESLVPRTPGTTGEGCTVV